MKPEEEKIQIISNESNFVTEIENAVATPSADVKTTAGKVADAEQEESKHTESTAQKSNDEVATNDGTIIETLDTVFHNKSGVAGGANLSGSDRADYYEARSGGKTDAEEELDTLGEQQ